MCSADKGRRISSMCGWLIVFVCVSLLYILTLAPDLAWQDSGDYQYHVAKLNLNRPGDVVRVHPLYIVTAHYLGRVCSFSYAYAANLVSALSMAIAVANIYLLVLWLVTRVWPALLSALTFALAHSPWFYGVQAQTYGMALATLSAGILLTVAYIKTGKIRYLFWMGFVSGLGASVHIMSQVGFAVIIAWILTELVRKRISIVSFLLTTILWAIGACLFWVVIAIEHNRTGDMPAALMSAIWGRWGGAVFNISRIPLLLKKSIMFFILNFPTLLVALAIPGLYLSFKKLGSKTIAWLLLVCTFLYALFAVRYNIPNQNSFFLPMYMFVSVYIGLGFAFIFKKHIRRWIVVSAFLLLLIPPTYPLIAGYARMKKVELGTRRHIPYRNVYRYYLVPWQQNQTGPRQFAGEVFTKVPKGAILVPDLTLMRTLIYMHEIEKIRPDVKLFRFGEFEEIREELQPESRIFTISDVKGYYPKWVEGKNWLRPFAISDTENIFEIIIPQTATKIQ